MGVGDVFTMEENKENNTPKIAPKIADSTNLHYGLFISSRLFCSIFNIYNTHSFLQ